MSTADQARELIENVRQIERLESQMVEEYCPYAQIIGEFFRRLAQVRAGMSTTDAWLALASEQEAKAAREIAAMTDRATADLGLRVSR